LSRLKIARMVFEEEKWAKRSTLSSVREISKPHLLKKMVEQVFIKRILSFS
jgi:hypothetical protein